MGKFFEILGFVKRNTELSLSSLKENLGDGIDQFWECVVPEISTPTPWKVIGNS